MTTGAVEEAREDQNGICGRAENLHCLDSFSSLLLVDLKSIIVLDGFFLTFSLTSVATNANTVTADNRSNFCVQKLDLNIVDKTTITVGEVLVAPSLIICAN